MINYIFTNKRGAVVMGASEDPDGNSAMITRATIESMEEEPVIAWCRLGGPNNPIVE